MMMVVHLNRFASNAAGARSTGGSIHTGMNVSTAACARFRNAHDCTQMHRIVVRHLCSVHTCAGFIDSGEPQRH